MGPLVGSFMRHVTFLGSFSGIQLEISFRRVQGPDSFRITRRYVKVVATFDFEYSLLTHRIVNVKTRQKQILP